MWPIGFPVLSQSFSPLISSKDSEPPGSFPLFRGVLRERPRDPRLAS